MRDGAWERRSRSLPSPFSLPPSRSLRFDSFRTSPYHASKIGRGELADQSDQNFFSACPMDRNKRLTRLPLAKVRRGLGRIIRRIDQSGQEFILEKNGRPVAALIGIDAFEDLVEAHDPALKRQIAEGYAEYRRGELTEDLDAYLARLKPHRRKRTSLRTRIPPGAFAYWRLIFAGPHFFCSARHCP